MTTKEQYKLAYRRVRIFRNSRILMSYDKVYSKLNETIVHKAFSSHESRDKKAIGWGKWDYSLELFFYREYHDYKKPGYAARKIARGNYSVYRPTLT